MGLLDVQEDAGSPSGSSSGSGSSTPSSGHSYRESLSGVSPDDFPVYKRRCPYLVIRETEDGWDYIRYPETPEVDIRFEWYGESEFEHAGYFRENEGWVRWFWTEDQFKRICRRVQEHENDDLRQVLDRDPEAAVKLIRRAANQYAAQKVELTERCPVCRRDIHVVHDDYEMVSGRRVCSEHNVADLANAGLLD